MWEFLMEYVDKWWFRNKFAICYYKKVSFIIKQINIMKKEEKTTKKKKTVKKEKDSCFVW